MVKEVGRFTRTACQRFRSIAATLNRATHLGQMCDAIFFAIPRDPEIEVWIAELGGATDCATMEGFSWAARVDFKTSASCRDVAAMARLMNNLRSKENEIINECSD